MSVLYNYSGLGKTCIRRDIYFSCFDKSEVFSLHRAGMPTLRLCLTGDASGVPQNASGRNCVFCNCVAVCAVPTTGITACGKLLLARLTDIKLSPRCLFFHTFLSVSWHGGIMPLKYANKFFLPYTRIY
jgi:hypothetical protein